MSDARPSADRPVDGQGRKASDQQPTEDFSNTDFDSAVESEAHAIDSTIRPPSYREPVAAAKPQDRRPELDLRPGETIDDFQVLMLIGRGAFGGVYLAEQQSLERRVALKVTANRGSEGRTLAQLEHDFIVRVFSEAVDESGRFRLLCMQLVVGTALDDVIDRLRLMAERAGEDGKPVGWTGKQYLAAIDAAARQTDGRGQEGDVFDPTALRDRELIGRSDDLQTVAWVGARLAEAVDHAHRRGVLHRDIKPANVLVNRYGRPLLADFNIAERTMPSGGPSGSFGGTIAYMAPEHLDAFNPRTVAGAEVVDERSDLYSLGLVLHEMLTGTPPFDDPERDAGRVTFVGTLADARRSAEPPIGDGPSGARKVLQRTLARSLEPDKQDRYESGARFAAALDGARELRTAEQGFPRRGWLTRAMQGHALRWLILMVVLPQAISSLVNIAYNDIEIGAVLSPKQWGLFNPWLILVYNTLAYPLLLGIGFRLVLPVFRVWREVYGVERVDPARVDQARRRALRLPLWLLMLVAAGWLPGGVLFPLVLDAMAGPIGWDVYAHFITSFTLSGLIAAAYSYGGVQFLVLRVMYPRLWADATNFRGVAREELASSLWRIRFIPRLAVSVPLVGALILLTISGSVDWRLRLLCIALILLGWAGYEMASSASRSMSRTLVALTGREA